MFCVLCVLRPSIYFICIGLALNFCGMYGDRRRVGLPATRARARVRRLTPTDRYPRDSNPGPLDLKSSILPLSYRPPSVTHCLMGLLASGGVQGDGTFRLTTQATGWLSQFKSHVEDGLFPLRAKANYLLPPGFFLSNSYISPLADPGALRANVPLKSTKICTFPVKNQIWQLS